MRLNMQIRKEILNAAMKHKFGEDTPSSMKARERALFMRVYEERVGLDILNDLKSFKHQDYLVRASHCCLTVSLHNGYKHYFSIYDLVPHIYHVHNHNYNTYGVKSLLLSEDIMKYLDDKVAYDEKYKKADAMMTAFLYSFTTLNQLVKQWPEGEAFYRRYMDTPAKSLVPMVIMKNINDEFNIPVKED